MSLQTFLALLYYSRKAEQRRAPRDDEYTMPLLMGVEVYVGWRSILSF